MTDYAYRVYDSIVQATNSELNLFFVIVAIVLAVVFTPLYTMILRDRKEKRKGDAESESTKHDKHLERESKMIEREKEIIAVVKENSAVIASFKTLLETMQEEKKDGIKRVHDRLDLHGQDIKVMISGIAEINTKQDRQIANQTEMSGKINKILLIVDNIPNSSNFSPSGKNFGK